MTNTTNKSSRNIKNLQTCYKIGAKPKGAFYRVMENYGEPRNFVMQYTEYETEEEAEANAHNFSDNHYQHVYMVFKVTSYDRFYDGIGFEAHVTENEFLSAYHDGCQIF